MASRDEVTSPTFTLLNEYAGRLTVYHLDLYRLKQSDELRAVSLDELYAAGGIVLIEWAERAEAELPGDRLDVRFEHLTETTRRITMLPSGAGYQRIMSAFETFETFPDEAG